MIEAGAVEASETANTDDLIVIDDLVVAIDPVIEDAGDPADPFVIQYFVDDTGMADSGMADSGMADSGVTDLGEIEGAVYEPAVYEPAVVEDGASEDGASADDSIMFVTGEWFGDDTSTKDLPADEPTGDLGSDGDPGRPVDPMPEWRTLDVPADASEDGVSDDDGMMFVTGEWFGDDTATKDLPADEPTGDLGSEGDPGRPVDPMPEWRTLDVPADETAIKDDSADDAGSIDDGSIDDGSIDDGIGADDSFDWTFEDFIKITGEDGTPPLYTMDPDDDLIFQTMGPVDETPGRGSDPLPFERTNADPVLVATVEIDRTPVNYAAADTFQSGLDLL